jgi:hypothetical protein
MSPVKYELGFYIPQDDILHIHRRDNGKSYGCLLAILLRVTSLLSRAEGTELTISDTLPRKCKNKY